MIKRGNSVGNEFYETAMELIEECSERLNGFVLNQEQFGKLEDACALAGNLAMRNGDGVVKFDVMEDGEGFVITVLCDDLILKEDMNREFFTLLKLSDLVSFSKWDDDQLCVRFLLGNMWVLG